MMMRENRILSIGNVPISIPPMIYDHAIGASRLVTQSDIDMLVSIRDEYHRITREVIMGRQNIAEKQAG